MLLAQCRKVRGVALQAAAQYCKLRRSTVGIAQAGFNVVTNFRLLLVNMLVQGIDDKATYSVWSSYVR